MQVIAQAATDSAAKQEGGNLTGTNLTVVGWGVLLLGLYALNKSGVGHEVIYYALALIVFFLFIFNYQRILPILLKDYKSGGN